MNKINLIDKLDVIIDRFSFCKENLYEIGNNEYRGLHTAFEDEFEKAYEDLTALMDALEKNNFESVDTEPEFKCKSKKDKESGKNKK